MNGKSETSTSNAVWTNDEREEQGWLMSGLHDAKQGVKHDLAAVGGVIQSGWGQVIGNKSSTAKGEWNMLMSRLSQFRDENLANLYRLASLMLFDKGDTLKYLDVTETHQDLVNKYNKLPGSDKSIVQSYAKQIQGDLVGYVSDNKGKKINYSSIDWANYHKNGLDYVPKDNYKALLHKGEMVLNAKEAETLRNAMQMNNMGGVEASWYSIDDGRRGGNYPRKITSAYKEKRSGNPGYHTGVDFAFPEGAAIGAA